jgi:hypothetical protein
VIEPRVTSTSGAGCGILSASISCSEVPVLLLFQIALAFGATHLNRAASPVATRLAASRDARRLKKSKAAASDDSGLCFTLALLAGQIEFLTAVNAFPCAFGFLCTVAEDREFDRAAAKTDGFAVAGNPDVYDAPAHARATVSYHIFAAVLSGVETDARAERQRLIGGDQATTHRMTAGRATG